MRFGVRFDTKQQTGGSNEEPPVFDHPVIILIPNCALKIPHWRSKMINLFRIAREIFRLKIFHNIP